jgi:hypothetical protein
MDAITLAPEGILEENIRTHSAIFSTVHGVLFGAVGETSPADLHGLLRAFRTDPRSPSRILPETPGGTLPQSPARALPGSAGSRPETP